MAMTSKRFGTIGVNRSFVNKMLHGSKQNARDNKIELYSSYYSVLDPNGIGIGISTAYIDTAV